MLRLKSKKIVQVKTVLIFLLCISIIISSNFYNVMHAEAVGSDFRLSTDFSSTQGQNQWYYRQWDGSKYSDMTWDFANNRWNGSQAYCLISNGWLHPDTNDAVLAWVAPRNGVITINSGTISVVSGGDGVNVKVLKGTTNVWPGPTSGWQSIAAGGSVNLPQKTMSVKRFDVIYFILNKNINNSNDTTSWNPSITYTDITQSVSWMDFSSTQGQCQWYYKQWDGSSYSDMTWDYANNRWKGSQTYCLITSNWMHTDANDPVIAWKAPKDGKIKISATSIKVLATSGDGIKAKILKNSVNVWPSSGWQTVSAGTSVTVPEQIISVVANDMLYFTINKNENNVSDSTNWTPSISYLPADVDIYQFSSDFTNLQGEKQWRFYQSASMNLSEMVWNSTNSRWQGNYTSCLLGSGWMAPDTNDAVLVWEAPKAGTIKISTSGGSISVLNGGGDGVKVMVAKNGSSVWPASGWQNISAGGSVSFPDQTMMVKAGERIYFNVNMNSTCFYDTTTWDPVITYLGKDEYQLTKDFASTQGKYQFYYKQWNGSSYSDMTWNSAYNRWNGSQTYCNIGSGWLHPDTNDPVLAWKAYKDGTVKITSGTGTISVLSGTGADGVSVKVLKNASNVWPSSGGQTISAGGSITFPEQTVTVSKDDILYFIINKNANNSFDTTTWDPCVKYVFTEQPGIAQNFSDTYKLSSGFSGSQGQYQWDYKQWDGSSYSNMTWDSTNNWWVGAQAGCMIGEGWTQPDNNDAVIAWKAPKGGTITIRGMVDHNSILGDGVYCKIMKNTAQVWPSSGWQQLIPNLTVEHVLQITVQTDDYIYFHLNKNSSTGNDKTFWDPIISYTENPRFLLDKSEQVVTPAQATNIGVNIFDSSVSIIPNGTNFDFYAATNQYYKKFTGTLDQPAQTLISSNVTFSNPNNVDGKWWPCNIYKDTDGGLLAFCHLENCTTFNGFWALGLAYSSDGGQTFNKLGKIVTQNVPEITSDSRIAYNNILGLPYVIKDGYFYVYYSEGLEAVCRASVTEVINAAKNGTVTNWKKYYNGAWNEDGLDGKASPIMPTTNQHSWGIHGDAAYSSTLGKYILTGYNQLSWGMGIWVAFSDDGITYDYPEFIKYSYDAKEKRNISPYQTIVNIDGSDNGVVGSSFYIYWTEWTDWNPFCNQLYRQKVTLNSAGFTNPTYDTCMDFNARDKGAKQWYYQEHNGTTYINLPDDKLNLRWAVSTSPDSLIGDIWQQPGTNTDSVRKWVAPENGTIVITANGGSIAVSSGSGADGVKIKVLKNSSYVWPTSDWQSISAGGTVTFPQQTVTVEKGDSIYFMVNRNSNNSFDTTTWEPIIVYQ